MYNQDYSNPSHDPSSQVTMRPGGIGPSASIPSAAPFVLAAIIIIGGVGLFLYQLFGLIGSSGDNATRVVVPGQIELTFEKPGDYSVFYEYRSEAGGRVYTSSPNFPGLECSLSRPESGEQVPLKLAGMNSTYSFGNRQGSGLFKFNIAEPGRYTFSAYYPEGGKGPDVVLAIGENFVGDFVVKLFMAIGTMFLTVGTAIPLIIVTSVRRAKAMAARAGFDPEGGIQ